MDRGLLAPFGVVLLLVLGSGCASQKALQWDWWTHGNNAVRTQEYVKPPSVARYEDPPTLPRSLLQTTQEKKMVENRNLPKDGLSPVSVPVGPTRPGGGGSFYP
jgi:hypothetical protein